MLWAKPYLGLGIDWSNPLAAGLVGCWALNEGSGLIAYNLGTSGPANNGIFQTGTAAPIWTKSQWGPSVAMSAGSSQYIDCGSITQLNGATKATLFGVGNRATNTNWTIGKSTTGTSQFLLMHQGADNTGYMIAAQAGTSQALSNSNAASPTGNFSSAFVYDGTLAAASVATLYVNGVKTAVTVDNTWSTGALASSTDTFRIGYDQADANFSTSRFDLVCLWVGQSLTATQVASLHGNPWQIFQSAVPWSMIDHSLAVASGGAYPGGASVLTPYYTRITGPMIPKIYG